MVKQNIWILKKAIPTAILFTKFALLSINSSTIECLDFSTNEAIPIHLKDSMLYINDMHLGKIVNITEDELIISLTLNNNDENIQRHEITFHYAKVKTTANQTENGINHLKDKRWKTSFPQGIIDHAILMFDLEERTFTLTIQLQCNEEVRVLKCKVTQLDDYYFLVIDEQNKLVDRYHPIKLIADDKVKLELHYYQDSFGQVKRCIDLELNRM